MTTEMERRAVVLQCDFELGEHVIFGPFRCRIMAITAHVNGAILYHIRGFNPDGDMVDDAVSGIELECT